MIGSREIWQAGPKTLRAFGLTGLIVFGLLGAWVHLRHALLLFSMHPGTASNVAIALWVTAAAMGTCALVSPRRLLVVYGTMSMLAMPIGIAVSYTVLTVLYFAVITPIGCCLRMLGRDPLRPAREAGLASGWRKREPIRDLNRYYRQY